MQWNMRGYWAQKLYLEHLIDEIKPHIICIQETHLKPKQSSYLSKYQNPRIRKDRNVRKGVGVAIFIKNSLNYIPINLITNYEITAVTAIIPTRSLCRRY